MDLRNRISFLAVCMLLLLSKKSYSQQETQYTQYMWNPVLLNPAAAGSSNMAKASVLYRKQWVSIEGAPGSMVFTADAPALSDKSALGLIIAKDKIGVHDDISVRVAYAYRLPLKNGSLGMGLQAGLKNHQARYSDLEIKDETDQNFRSGDLNYFLPEFGFGLHYTTERTTIGFSVPRIIDNVLGKSLFNTNNIEKRHYYLSAGHNFTVNEQFDVLPGVLVKATEGAPLQADINTIVTYQKKLSAGIGYRTGASVNFLLKAKFNDHLSFGYSYDWATNILKQYSYGSHEIMVTYMMDVPDRFKLKKYRNTVIPTNSVIE